MKQYKAHWSALLVIISALLTVLCLGIAWFYLLRGGWWLSLLLVALTIGCALFSIRGYTITPDAILVHRPFWRTRLPLADLRAAEIKRAPTLRGIRIGNGGFFSF